MSNYNLADTLAHKEVILVSEHKDSSLFIIESLKPYDFQDLLWLKHFQQVMDFIYGQGLYKGRQLSNCPKAVIIDDSFLKDKNLAPSLKFKMQSCQYPMITVSEFVELHELETSHLAFLA